MINVQHTVTVLGAGSWGTALALLLAKNGCEVRLWDRDEEHINSLREKRVNARYLPNFPFPDRIVVYHELGASIENVTDLMMAVPSHAFREVFSKMLPHLSPAVRIAWGTKGLDVTHQLLHVVVQSLLSPSTPIAVLSGPSIAREVAAGLPTAISLASNNQSFSQDLTRYLYNEYFRVYPSDDLIGVELCGAVKNVLAIAAGISDGMSLGANARSALITRGLTEMGRLCQALGGKQKTLLELAGVGDLILTCTDDQSRNRRFGLALGKGLDRLRAEKDIGQAVEGLYNAKQVYALAKSQGVEMPITQQVYRILYENVSSRAAVEALLQRVPKTS